MRREDAEPAEETMRAVKRWNQPAGRLRKLLGAVREADVFVDDRGFAQQLPASLETAMRSGSLTVPPRQWKRQSLWLRLRVWLAYGVVRLLTSFATYERFH